MGLMGNQPCVCGDSAAAHRNPAHACDAGRYTPVELPLTTGEGTTASGAIQWLRMMNDDAPQMSTTKLRSGQVLAELEAALAECDRLREQLDAARQALAPFVTRGSGPDRPARAPTWEVGGQYVVWLEKGEWERGRAALGVGDD